MVCAFQEEVAPQVSACVQPGNSPADALWTAESLASLSELQQSMSNQLVMRFTGNRTSPGSPISGTIPGLASFNGKHLVGLSHMMACSSSSLDTIFARVCSQQVTLLTYLPISMCTAQNQLLHSAHSAQKVLRQMFVLSR